MSILREEYIGGQRLILGDCLDIMPTLGRFDACLTDPPYGIGAGTGIGKVTKEGSDFRGRAQWDSEPPSADVFEFILQIADEHIIWGGNYFALPPTKCFLIWDKIQPENFSLAMAEIAWSNIDKPAKIFRWKSMSINGGAPKLHPTQKPLSLMEWCLHYVPRAKTVLDPFAGSGTTLVACQRMGRHGTGIERDPRLLRCDVPPRGRSHPPA